MRAIRCKILKYLSHQRVGINLHLKSNVSSGGRSGRVNKKAYLCIAVLAASIISGKSLATTVGETLYRGEIAITDSGGVELLDSSQNYIAPESTSRLFGVHIESNAKAREVVSGKVYSCTTAGFVDIIRLKGRIILLKCSDGADLAKTLLDFGYAEEDCVESANDYGRCK